jgi:hypothetical protein
MVRKKIKKNKKDHKGYGSAARATRVFLQSLRIISAIAV